MLNVAHVRARSLSSSIASLREHVYSLDYAIIGITGTWLSGDIPSSQLDLLNYTFLRLDRLGCGGGVGMFFRNNLKFKLLMSNCCSYLECVWCEVSLGLIIFVIGIVYRPPMSDLNKCLKYLEDVLSNLRIKFDNVFCLGDFNLDALKVDSSLTSRLFEIFVVFDLSQCIRAPTRITGTSISLIDLFFDKSDLIASV